LRFRALFAYFSLLAIADETIDDEHEQDNHNLCERHPTQMDVICAAAVATTQAAESINFKTRRYNNSNVRSL